MSDWRHTFTPEQLELASLVGARARSGKGSSTALGAQDSNQNTRDLVGALGQIAFSEIWSGTPYTVTSLMACRKGDDGWVEVRATYHERGHLLLYPEDADSEASPVVLVVLDRSFHSARLAGWCSIGQGMNQFMLSPPWKGGRDCHKVPQWWLRPMDELEQVYPGTKKK